MKYLILILILGLPHFLIGGDVSPSATTGAGCGAGAGVVGEPEKGFAGAHAHKRTGSSEVVIDFKTEVAPPGSVTEQVRTLMGLSSSGTRGFAGSDQSRFTSFGRGEPGDSIALLLASRIDEQNKLAKDKEKAKELRQAEKKLEREVAAKAKVVDDNRACCINALNGFGVIAGFGISIASLIISSQPKEKQD